jgi:hypothetical protein
MLMPPKKLQRFYCKPPVLGMNWGKSADWGRIGNLDNQAPSQLNKKPGAIFKQPSESA